MTAAAGDSGTVRRRRWRVLVAGLVLSAALVAGEPTGAQAGPAPRSIPPPAEPAAGAASGQACGGAAGAVVPEGCWGRFPSGHYDIGFDPGAWNDLHRQLYGAFTDLVFQAARGAVVMALWLVGWAYGFGVYDRLGAPAVAIAAAYERDVVGPLGLGHLAWLWAVAWAGVAALRGRLAMAAGELVTSVVAAGLAGLVLANPAGYLAGTFDTMARLSGALLATGTGHPPPTDAEGAGAVLAPVQARLHGAFVEQPYDHLNWGGPLPPACAAVRDAVVADGPHGADDGPREAMEAAGCGAQAHFNRDPSPTRLLGAVLTLVAAGAVVVLVVLVALTVVVAQVLAVVLFALSPLALVAAVLPGAGRELAWRWLAALARVVLAVVGMSLVLSLLLLGSGAVLEATEGAGLLERFALLDAVVVALLVARRRILAAGHGLAGSLGQRLASRRAGGERAAPWLAAPAVAGASGFALGAAVGPDRSGRSSRLVAAAGRNHLADRRVARSQRGAEHRAERRASAVVARQRTELGTDRDGNTVSRRVTTVDGPVPASRRARQARERLERQLGGSSPAGPERGWGPAGYRDGGPPVAPEADPGPVDAPVDDGEA